MFSGLDERVIDIIERFGYTGIALLIALETIFPPLPSEIILPLGGFTASRGDLELWGVLLAATVGSVVGAVVLYWVGAWIGMERLGWFVNRYGRLLMLKESDLAKTFVVFERYNSRAVMIGRMIPVVRSLISLPAGLTRMSLPTFVVYTAIGSAIWNSALIGSGYLLGDQWERVESFVGYFQYLVILCAIGFAGWFLWSRLRARSNQPPGSTEIEPS